MAGGLQSAVQQLQSYGRGPDTMLAHISPDEAQFIDKIQGGRRTNPMTGLPEYSLFGNILKAIARAGAAVAGFTLSGGNPLAAAAAAAAVTKLTGGSWNDSLKAGAFSGIGAGIGNLASSGGSAFFSNAGLSAGSAAGGGTAAVTAPGVAGGEAGSGIAAVAPSAAEYAVPEITSAMAPAAASGLAGLGQGLSSAYNAVGGSAGVASGLGALSAPISAPEVSAPPPVPPQQQIDLNVSGGDRGYTPYTGDYAHYGEVGHPTPTFFQRPNARPVFNPPPVQATPTADEANLEKGFGQWARGGRVRGYAEGGAVNKPSRKEVNDARRALRDLSDQFTNLSHDTIGGYDTTGLRSRGLNGAKDDWRSPALMQDWNTNLALSKHIREKYGELVHNKDDARDLLPDDEGEPSPYDPRYARGGRIGLPHFRHHIPSPAAQAGTIKGAGDGTSDSVPAQLSDGEHVLDAATVSAIGQGSNDAGHRKINAMKTAVRSAAGFKNPSRPPAMRASHRAGIMSLVPKV